MSDPFSLGLAGLGLGGRGSDLGGSGSNGVDSALPSPNRSAARGSAAAKPAAVTTQATAPHQTAPVPPPPVLGAKPTDPALLSLIRGALDDICAAMDDRFSDRALAPHLSRDRAFANGMFHWKSGVALAVTCNRAAPLLAVTLQDGIDGLLRSLAATPADSPQPGDIFLFNDPFLGTTHATDLRMATPVFIDDRLVGWAGNACRWLSLGGGAPGGITPKAVDRGGEGLCIPPVRLFRRGEIERDPMAMVLANVPDADRHTIDIMAQATALGTGAERLEALAARYGVDGFNKATALLFDRAALRTGRRLAALPEGTWRTETLLDSDGVVDGGLTLSLTLSRGGQELVVDFAGSSPPCRGPLNCPPALVRGAARLALHGLFPDLPMEGGSWHALRVPEPVGTFLHAVPPNPVSAAAGIVVPRIVEACFAAIGQLASDRMPARSGYGGLELALDGTDPGLPADAADELPAVPSYRYTVKLAFGAGRGGNAAADGQTPLAPPYGPTGFGSVEALERAAPLRLTHLRLRAGGGGLGAHTGGDGLTVGIQIMRGNARLATSGDLALDGPSGRAGGGIGQPGRLALHRQNRPSRLSRSAKEADIMLSAGDSVQAETPSGGGFGSPMQRQISAAAIDMVCGRLTVDEAGAKVGIVIDPETGRIDMDATAALRGDSTESRDKDAE